MTDYWTERRGPALEMSLCQPCFNTLSKKIVATVEQDQVQPAYTLQPQRVWIKALFLAMAGGAIGAATILLVFLDWLKHAAK